MYNNTYSYNVNPQKRRFCSDAQGTPITELPTFYFGERPVFTMTFPDDVLTEGEKLVFVMDNENRFLDSHSITGLEPVMAWCIHEITAEDVTNKSIDLELYCFSQKYADVINGHDNAVTCTLSLFIKSLDENLNCMFSTLATTLAYAEPTIVSPDCVFNDLPIDMYLTRDEMNALIAEVEALQREAIEKAEQAQQSAQEAKEAADSVKDLKPLILTSPPTTSTVGSVGQLATWHDPNAADPEHADHIYHLVFISTSDSATLYHWEECVLESQRNVANGFVGLDGSGKMDADLLDESFIKTSEKGVAGGVPTLNLNAKINDSQIPVDGGYGINLTNHILSIVKATNDYIDSKSNNYRVIAPSNLNYAVRSVLPNVTEIPAATSDYSLVDSSATTNNHSHVYSHAPTTAPTYRLPQVTDTTIAHYIELTVDFTAVQTYSFLDYQGDALVPLFTPSIAAGDVYTFKMEYSAIKAAWLVYPQKQGAVADDFVMRGEVGAANGVASLDANAKVPSNQLPQASGSVLGVVSTSSDYGTRIINNKIGIQSADQSLITVRGSNYRPIVPNNLNAAVTAALTDSNKISLTDAQKATAQSVFGVGGPITAIPAATSAYTLAEGIFTHAPTNAPTYTLPNITDDIRTHEVVLVIDFSSVQTFSFLVDGGGDVTFQSYANPTMGDVWAFRCWWYGGKWRIAPTKIKNCVTRQLANGSLAITDAVGGDALALKMTAPQSVVMNQRADAINIQNRHGLFFVLNADGSVRIYGTCDYTGTYGTTKNMSIIKGHKYAFCMYGAESYTNGNLMYSTTPANGYSAITTSSGDYSYGLGIHIESGDTVDLTVYTMAVDLTQYFNGDTALINSITSWDDLVAYDPRFAEYVEYNTGTVVGVQPSVHVTQKNLFNVDRQADSFSESSGDRVFDFSKYYVGMTLDNRSIEPRISSYSVTGTTITGTTASNGAQFGLGFSVRVAGNKTYRLSVSSREQNMGVAYYTNGGHFILSGPTTGLNSTLSFTTPANCGIVLFVIRSYNNASTFSVSDVQIELGSTATAYEPYHDGGTAQAPAPLFAVGNAADEYEAVAGTLAQTLKQVDLSTLTWTAGDGTYSATITDIKPSTLNFLLPNGYVGSVSGTTLTITASSTPTGTMVYEKATKSTTDVTPVQIDLQSGSNTAMQTDGGRLAPIDITYESNEI